MGKPLNMLFVCSRNEWRSRTAETIFRNTEKINVKSAGTSKTANVRINETLINWSDVIFVMENKHKKVVQEQYRELLSTKELIVLDIPDEYEYMDEELIEELNDSIKYYLKERR